MNNTRILFNHICANLYTEWKNNLITNVFIVKGGVEQHSCIVVP